VDYFTEDDGERGGILEDRDEYISGERLLGARAGTLGTSLLAAASRTDIGERIDRALDAIERDKR